MVEEYRNFSYKTIGDLDPDRTLIVLPLGALEQHGPQAPLGTDGMIAEEMVKLIKEKLLLLDKDGRLAGNVLTMPVIPVGSSVEHLNFPGSISFKPETYYHMLYDIVESLSLHGFKNVAFLICHGGNRAICEVVSRQIRHDTGSRLYLISSGSFSDEMVKKTISKGNENDFHGGEMETSMVMAIDENLTDLKESRRGHYKYKSDNGSLNFSGPLALPWLADDFVDDDGKPLGIGGDPSGASGAKGKIILDVSARDCALGIAEILEKMES